MADKDNQGDAVTMPPGEYRVKYDMTITGREVTEVDGVLTVKVMFEGGGVFTTAVDPKAGMSMHYNGSSRVDPVGRVITLLPLGTVIEKPTQN